MRRTVRSPILMSPNGDLWTLLKERPQEKDRLQEDWSFLKKQESLESDPQELRE